jgi:hypothetical protein
MIEIPDRLQIGEAHSAASWKHILEICCLGFWDFRLLPLGNRLGGLSSNRLCLIPARSNQTTLPLN